MLGRMIEYDDFDIGTLDAWTVSKGGFSIAGAVDAGSCQVDTLDAGDVKALLLYRDSTYSFGDGYFEVDLSTLGTAGAPKIIGLAWRVTDDSGTIDGYCVRFGRGTQTLNMFRWDDTVATQIGSHTYGDSTGMTLGVYVEGDRFDVFVDGGFHFSVTDSAYLSGQAGLVGAGSNTGGVFDRFTIRELRRRRRRGPSVGRAAPVAVP